MKICLFNSIGNLGIVTGWKKLMFDDHLIFETDREGELRIGEKSYPVVNGQARVPQYHLVFGERRNIYFADKQGNVFACGSISRTGSRTIDIVSEVEHCLIACIEKLDEQDREIRLLKEEIRKIKNEHGVSFN